MYFEERKWLFVYDNVENLDLLYKHLPSGHGRIIVTTRYKWLAFKIQGPNAKREVSIFDDEESLELFEGLCTSYDPGINREQEREQIRTLLNELGGLALGIEQIAAFVSYRGESISSFLKQYEKASKKINANSESSRAEKSLATVWEVQFNKIEGSNAAKVLGYLCLMNPEAIPISLLIPDDDEQETALDMDAVLGCDETEYTLIVRLEQSRPLMSVGSMSP
jgi:hypothetical protein